MADITVRPMTAADLDAVAVIETGAPDPWTRPQLQEELESDFARCFVLCEDGVPAAFCSVQAAADEASLNAITVRTDRRQRGYGAQLLTQLERLLSAEGITALYLEVRTRNAPAIALYEKDGFVLTGKRPHFYRDPPDDAFTMKKEL